MKNNEINKVHRESELFIFITLLLMISFPVVNALLFTPALPSIANYYAISMYLAQSLILWFLIAYALGQLIYAPLANYFGRKPALFMGILLQILSCIICIVAANQRLFLLLILGRFFLALGSGVGLKMTFTFLNEYYEPKIAVVKTAYIMLAFAIIPGLGIALGGFLNSHFGWPSCFYACAIYGILLFFLVLKLPETAPFLDKKSFQLSHLINAYFYQLRNKLLITSGLMMGLGNAFVYVFAAVAPFIAIDYFKMASSTYGLANLLPPLSLGMGLLTSARFSKIYFPASLIFIGILIKIIGLSVLIINLCYNLGPFIALFLPMMIIYFGLGLVLPNASFVGMTSATDKAYASAILNFINMSVAVFFVFILDFFPLFKFSLSIIYAMMCLCMLITYYLMYKFR